MIESDPREAEAVRADLASDDEELRRLAVERIAVLPAGEAIACLSRCLGDASWRVRKAAAERFAEAPADWDVAPALIEALGDGENPGRRNAAVEALVRCGPRVIERLIGAADCADRDVRKLVVDALAGIGSERAVPTLVRLLSDPDANVRAAAADALGGLGGDPAREALTRSACDPSEDALVRFSALRALARLEADLPVASLASALRAPVLQPPAFAVLAASRDPQAEPVLLDGLASEWRAAREAAMEALLRRAQRSGGAEAQRLRGRSRERVLAAPAVLADAIERLATAELGARIVLAQFLGWVRAREAVVPLLAVASDDAIREVALAALAEYGEELEPVLAERLSELEADERRIAYELLATTSGAAGLRLCLAGLDESDPRLRAAAARALGERGAEEALAPLVRRLVATGRPADLDAEEEREALAGALAAIASGRRGAPPALRAQAVELLSEALRGAEEPVRVVIARLLAEAAHTAAAEPLGLLLSDPSATVRATAVAALARLDVTEVPELLRVALVDESPKVRAAAAFALGERDDPAHSGDLLRLAQDLEPEVRGAALRALGARARRCGAGRSGPPAELLDALHRGLRDEPSVALAALEALELMGGAAAAEAATWALESPVPELVQAAVRCLGEHGGPSELERLIPLLAHPSWSVRVEAVEALAKRQVRSAVPALLRRLECEDDPFVREPLLAALSRLEG